MRSAGALISPSSHWALWPREIAAVLRGGGLVALACDLPQGPGVEVNFFARRATVPTGPASLALRTGAALLTAYTRWNSPGHYHVHVDPLISLPLTGDRRRDIAALMQAVVDRSSSTSQLGPASGSPSDPSFVSSGGAPVRSAGPKVSYSALRRPNKAPCSPIGKITYVKKRLTMSTCPCWLALPEGTNRGRLRRSDPVLVQLWVAESGSAGAARRPQAGPGPGPAAGSPASVCGRVRD
ncbi:hypothetical protein [Candidatus Nephthysia bennettiae]|uniref:Uncharacterized protein n=1 Tax=Candidatus Nephthysia bennettiae TaxID=3127016 RepID=A0A934K9T0_9BACT|nr:hypothetical protein [Candidatus Dormibacteraeota bacterium]